MGNDWAEGHHDVYLLDEEGARLGFSRLPEGLAGVARLHEMVAKHASDAAEVVVGIETDRGLWVGALVGAGYQVYAINPMAVSRLAGPSPPGWSQIRPRRRQGVSRSGTNRPSQPPSGSRGQPRRGRHQDHGPCPSEPDLGPAAHLQPLLHLWKRLPRRPLPRRSPQPPPCPSWLCGSPKPSTSTRSPAS